MVGLSSMTRHSRRMASFPPAGGNAKSVRSDVPKACKETLRPSNHIVQRVDFQYVLRSAWSVKKAP
jgi:hypothetical protein